MMIAALFFLTVPAASSAECLPVSGSEILARDLAAANMLFSALDPEAVFGFAPIPGARRLVLGSELAAFARRNGLGTPTGPIADLCVQRAAAPLTAADLSAALERAAGAPGIQIELLDYSRWPLPAGRIEFQWNAIAAPPAANWNMPVIWRGRLYYDSQHSIAIWAKVRISVERPAVIAVTDLLPGHVIEKAQVRSGSLRMFPGRSVTVDAIDSVLGKTVAGLVRAGQPVPLSMLRQPDDVTAGEKVQVRVVDGSAYVSLEGTALTAGRKGATISLRNPSNGRVFRGVVEEKGLVLVHSGGPA